MPIPGAPEPGGQSDNLARASSLAWSRAVKAANEYRMELEAIKRAGGSLASEIGANMALLRKAAQSANREGIEQLTQKIRMCRDAGGELGAWTDSYRRISRDAFDDTTDGAAALEDNLDTLIEQWSKLGIAADKAMSARAGKGISAIESDMGVERYEKRDRQLMEVMQKRGMDVSAIKERIDNRAEIRSRKLQQVENEGWAGSIRNAKRAEQSVKGLTSILGSGAAGTAVAKAMDRNVLGTGALKKVLLSEAATAKGVAPTLFMGTVSTVIGSLAKAIGPLSAALAGPALFGRVITAVFEGMVDVQKVATGQVRVLSTTTNVSMLSMTKAMLGSKDAIRQFAGVGLISGAAISDAFDKEIVPAAQRAMFTFNTLDRSASTVNAWTGAIAGAAIEGNLLGKSYDETAGIISKLGHAFGGSAASARRAFQEIAGGSRGARLSFDAFAASMGDIDELARRLGEGGRSAIEEFSVLGLSASKAGIQSGAQRAAIIGGASNLMGDMPRMLGLGTAALGPGMMGRYVDAHQGTDSGAKMARLSLDVLRGTAMGAGGLKPMSALQGKDPNKAFEAAQFMGFATGMNPEAFLDKKFSKKYEEMLMSGAAPGSEKDKALRAEAAALGGDNTQQAMLSIIDQQGIMASMLSALQNIAKVVVAFGMNPKSTMISGVRPNSETLQSSIVQ